MRLIDADATLETIIGLTELATGEGAALAKALVFAALKSESIIPTVSGWISVKDRMPDEEDCYLAYGAEARGCDILFYDAANGDWISMGHTLADGEVTYWMPLPEPPKEVQENGD